MAKKILKLIMNSAIVLTMFLLIILVGVLFTIEFDYTGKILYLNPDKSIIELDKKLQSTPAYGGYVSATNLIRCTSLINKKKVESYAFQQPIENYEIIEGIDFEQYQGDHLPVLILNNSHNVKLWDVFQVELHSIDDNNTNSIIVDVEVIGILFFSASIIEAEVDIGLGVLDTFFLMPREYEELLSDTNKYLILDNGMEQEYLDIIDEYGYYTYNRMQGYYSYESYNIIILLIILSTMLLSYSVMTLTLSDIKFILINTALSGLTFIIYLTISSLMDIIIYNLVVNIIYLIMGLLLLLINVVSLIIAYSLRKKKGLVITREANYEKY